MHPILYKLGPLEFRAYGLMLAISFIAGIYLARYRARKRGIDQNLILDLSLFIVLAAVVGSRLFYILTHLPSYSVDPFRALRIWEGGLSMYGGVILALIASFFFIRSKGESFTKIADVIAPSIALGIFITRIGCFFNGCCFGKVCDLPWAVTFPHDSFAGQQFPELLIHPTQLYSSFYGLAILGILLLAEKRSTGPGYLLGLFLILYSISRFLVDFVRYYEPSSIAHISNVAITYNQIISTGLFVVGWYFLLMAGRNSPPTNANQE